MALIQDLRKLTNLAKQLSHNQAGSAVLGNKPGNRHIADKLNKMAQSKQLAAVKRKLGGFSADVSLQPFSALKRTGIDELALVMRK